MKLSSFNSVLAVLFVMVVAAQASAAVPAGPVVPVSATARAEVSATVPVKATKYVRNVSSPNGFGDSASINGVIYFPQPGEVKASDGDILEYALLVKADSKDLVDVTVKDVMAPFTEYVPGSTQLNRLPLADVEGVSAVIGGVRVNDVHAPLHSGRISQGQAAVLVYQARVNLAQ